MGYFGTLHVLFLLSSAGFSLPFVGLSLSLLLLSFALSFFLSLPFFLPFLFFFLFSCKSLLLLSPFPFLGLSLLLFPLQTFLFLFPQSFLLFPLEPLLFLSLFPRPPLLFFLIMQFSFPGELFLFPHFLNFPGNILHFLLLLPLLSLNPLLFLLFLLLLPYLLFQFLLLPLNLRILFEFPVIALRSWTARFAPRRRSHSGRCRFRPRRGSRFCAGDDD